MPEPNQPRVDMSPRGIELRLRQLAGLYKLGISLQKARPNFSPTSSKLAPTKDKSSP